MADRLKGKRVVFIGAATGIGRETVRQFAAEGAQLVIADKNAEQGQASAAADKLGGIDVLVNNAAIQYSGAITDFDVERWDRIYAVNVKGIFLACKHAIPHLRKSKAASIVSTASLAGLRGGPGMTAYSSTKGAVIALTTALALELAPDRIRVNAVCPGWVDTPFNNPAIDYMGGADVQARILSAMVPLGRQAVPAEIAPLFVYLASDESIFMTAQSIVIDGGVYN